MTARPLRRGARHRLSAPGPRVQLLLRNFDEAYDRKAWHGPNLRAALRGLDAQDASWRPAPARHNVWELLLHAAYSKYAVRRRLTGEKHGSFPMKGNDWWFARPESGTEAEWRRDLALLDRCHRALREVIERVPDRLLDSRSIGSRQTNVTLIAGSAAHDVYHAGQIRLVKALMRRRRGRRRKEKR